MAPPAVKYKNKRQFLLKNLLRGLGFLAILIALFLLFKKYAGAEYISWLEPIYSKPFLMYMIYTASEVFGGIIPPELFMIWGLTQGDTETYAWIVATLMFISYAAGWLTFMIGKRSHSTLMYRFLKRKYFSKYEFYFQEFGGFLIIVAAVTPIPYSAICLLVGAADYKISRFFAYSLFRLARFIVYAFIVWEANMI